MTTPGGSTAYNTTSRRPFNPNRVTQSVNAQRRSRMHDLNLTMSPRLETAGPTALTDTSLTYKTIDDDDQVRLMDNSNKIATINFMQ